MEVEQSNPPDLYEAIEYRTWLRETLAWYKQRNGLYGLRYVALRLGIDPSTLTKVLAGQMHLNERFLPQLSSFLKLDQAQSEYLESLYKFGKAKTAKESQRLFAELVKYRNPRAKTVAPDQVRYFQHWYHVALREFLGIRGDVNDPRSMARALQPSIKVDEARSALQVLNELGLVQTRADGTWQVCDAFLSTGGGWNSAAIRLFQQQMLQLGLDSLHSIPKEDRDLSTLTLSMSRACFEAMRERIARFRHELMDMVRADGDPEAVVQVNLQLFPLSRWEFKV